MHHILKEKKDLENPYFISSQFMQPWKCHELVRDCLVSLRKTEKKMQASKISPYYKLIIPYICFYSKPL